MQSKQVLVLLKLFSRHSLIENPRRSVLLHKSHPDFIKTGVELHNASRNLVLYRKVGTSFETFKSTENLQT